MHTIKTSWKQKNNIWRLFWRESMGKTQKNKKPRENQQKTIFGDSLGKLYWQNQKNLEKTKKPKNQNCSENVWSEAHVCFFLVLPMFFFGFLLVLTLKKLKKLKVFFVFWIKWWLKNCEKPKKSRFFLFLGVCGFSFFLVAQWKTKKKTLSFFGFSHCFNHHFIQETKKTLSFF